MINLCISLDIYINYLIIKVYTDSECRMDFIQNLFAEDDGPEIKCTEEGSSNSLLHNNVM